MAAENVTRTDVKLETVPQVTIPEIGVSEGRYGALVFQIQTRKGRIEVSSSHCAGGGAIWECRGSAEALADLGLIKLAWLPGLPGNNKVRQTVLFGADGAQLVRGNRRGRKLDGEVVTVVRVNRDTFIAAIPATPEQAGRIAVQFDEWKARLSEANKDRMDNLARQSAISEQKKLLADDVRLQIGGIVGHAQSWIMAAIENSAYSIDPSTEAAIDEGFRQIQVLINRAVLKPKVAMVRDGNVIYLKR